MLVREKLKINYFYYKISGSNFLLDLPVYCRGNEAKDFSTRDLNNGLVDPTSRTGCGDSRENNRPLHNKRTVGVIEGLSHMAGNCSPVHMTSSLLLGSLSPYFSADDTIDGLLLPDVEEFVSCFLNSQDFCLSRQFKSEYLRIQVRSKFCSGYGKVKKFYFISK
jgi:hypothetical protein